MVGPAHPPGMGPDSRSGYLGLPNWVLVSLRGNRASAEVVGAGTEALVASTFPAGCRGRRPKSRPVFGLDHPKANRCMTNSCRDTEAPPLSGACRLRICYMGIRCRPSHSCQMLEDRPLKMCTHKQIHTWQYAINAWKLAHRQTSNFRTSGKWNFRKSGYPEFRISGFPEVPNSGNLGSRIAGFPDKK